MLVPAFLFHILVWKIYIPKRQTKVLLAIFFSALISGESILWIISYRGLLEQKYALTIFLDYVHVALFFISVTLAYMITYSAIEVDSPSLVMINAIAKAGKEGLDEKLFYQMMNGDILIKPRINDLLNDKMAYLEGYKYKLTPKGRLLVRIFILYRKLLNAPKGG